MRIGGYSHLNGVTFFCDIIKIRGIKKGQHINYDIEWIDPPGWLRKLEGRFILGSLVILYYQWKILGKKIRTLFIGLGLIYLLDLIFNLDFIDEYFNYYTSKYLWPIIIIGLLLVVLNFKKIIQTLRFHGAEHKVINCFIENGYVDLYSAKKASRFNKRCGSNIVSVFIILYIPILILDINSILLTLVIFLLAIQIVKFFISRDFAWEKHVQLLQWLTVQEPGEDQLRLAVNTFKHLQRAYYIYSLEASKI